MEQVTTLDDILQSEIRDLYSAENQLVKALPKIIKKASSPDLKKALTRHLSETENQVSRLEKIAKELEFKVGGKTCAAMKGLIEEGNEIIKETEGSEALIDALLIGASQRIEHYEMAGYGTARAIAETLGYEEVTNLLQETLDEEGAADKKLTAISEDTILPNCSNGSANEDEENDEAGVSARRKVNQKSARLRR